MNPNLDANVVLDRVAHTSWHFWVAVVAIGVGLGVLLRASTWALRVLRPVVLVLVAFGLCVVFWTWVHDRGEPYWATPVVDWVGALLPHK